MEQFKDINGLEGYYQISNTGVVRSLDRVIKNRLYKGSIIKPLIGYGGYYTVQLRKNKSKHIYYVHRLVAEHFCDKASDGLVINHIDENKLNNQFKNLEFITISKNISHSRRGAGFLSRKYSIEDVINIRKMKQNGHSLYTICKKLNANSGTISNILNHKTYKNI